MAEPVFDFLVPSLWIKLTLSAFYPFLSHCSFMADGIKVVRSEIHMKVKVKSLSHVRVFATPWTVAYQAPPSLKNGIFQARVLEWIAISFSK